MTVYSPFQYPYTEAPLQIVVDSDHYVNLLDLAATNFDISIFIGLKESQVLLHGLL